MSGIIRCRYKDEIFWHSLEKKSQVDKIIKLKSYPSMVPLFTFEVIDFLEHIYDCEIDNDHFCG